MGIKLGDIARGRDNNFNLIRFIAAYSVLISHSFPLTHGLGKYEPFARIGYSLGGIAVDVFFLTSGFLVTASLFRLQEMRAFAKARAWRILPALVAMVIVIGLAIGPTITTLPLSEYFTDHTLYQFLVNNVLLLLGLEYQLPGVFVGLPANGMVNGSLWTLPLEVKCYLSLMLLWWLAGKTRLLPERFMLRAALTIVSSCLVLFWISHAGWSDSASAFFRSHHLKWLENWHLFRLFFMFFSGAAYYLLRAHIPMTSGMAAVAAAVMGAAVVWPSLFFWLYPLTISYLVLYFAYVPKGALLQFNRLGDYSYGTYIYAWPMQQLVILLNPGIGPYGVMGYASIATIVMAMLSWHLVEKPALSRKDRSLHNVKAPIAVAAPSPGTLPQD